MIRYKCEFCGRIYMGWSPVTTCYICDGELYEEKDSNGQGEESKQIPVELCQDDRVVP